ncbi:MAG: DNA polymerase III subunit gamma/tau [Planctomycetes bacterium]|nr:DNA polymerase III subunit gamma/tau [Planctomycetota bacterium]
MNAALPAYTAMARRFRPQTFDAVVGQQHVAQALKNAIAASRVAHAYLFTGARGVGKTSMARILAKALNCPNAQDGVPCNQCEICRGISAGNDVDVLEIDGASNRGIDDIRTLRANVGVKSMRTRYKVYIIDEVHMLTKEAFNALLKTLEEPPPGVKFVFCTTEPTRVPDTILSRCQRFDFATIETQKIVERLDEIARADGFDVEPKALELVARRASGSMRDSQSLFDQLLAFGEEKISADDVHRLLGTADDDRLMELFDAMIAGERGRALDLLDQGLAQGVQLGELLEQLIHYARDLMVIASGAESVSLAAVSGENRPRLVEQAGRWGMATILAALDILGETRSRMFRVTFDRPLAELALVRVAMLEDLEGLANLVAELKSGGTAAPQSPARAATKRPAAASAAQAQKKSAPEAAVNEGPAVAASAKPAPPDPPQPPLSKGGSTPGEAPLEAGTENGLWTEVLSRLDDRLRGHARVAGRVATSGPNLLDVIFPSSYHFSKQYCEQPEVLARLERIATEVAGRPVRIRCLLDEDESPANGADADESSAPVDALPDEFVEEAMAVFGGRVVKVEALTGLR